jgi:hypothetical protein
MKDILRALFPFLLSCSALPVFAGASDSGWKDFAWGISSEQVRQLQGKSKTDWGPLVYFYIAPSLAVEIPQETCGSGNCKTRPKGDLKPALFKTTVFDRQVTEKLEKMVKQTGFFNTGDGEPSFVFINDKLVSISLRFQPSAIDRCEETRKAYPGGKSVTGVNLVGVSGQRTAKEDAKGYEYISSKQLAYCFDTTILLQDPVAIKEFLATVGDMLKPSAPKAAF